MQEDTIDFCLLENASKHFGFAPTKMADPFLLAMSSLEGQSFYLPISKAELKEI